MPHRPQDQGQSPHSNGGSVGVETSSIYTPPRVPGTAAAAIMRQPNTASQALAATMYAGVVTPLAGANKAWIAAASGHGAMLPSLDSRNKSTDSTDRSMGNASHDAASVATLATEDDREATASALLMVAKAAEREHFNSIIQAASLASGSSSASAMPLKKRKKHLEILRRQQQRDDENDEEDSMSEATDKETPSSTTATTAEQDPCHVSPVSHSSAEHGLRAESTDDSTPTRSIIPPSRGTHTSSYDSKDVPMTYRGAESKQATLSSTTQELLDSAKVHSTAQIGVPNYPSQVLIPHFPTVLHQVLSDKEFDGKVVHWLPDGEAWKVLRWDALRREVLPRYFSDLRDENGGGCGTIDAFLFHLSAWGFEEVKDGTDVGAYRHDLFIRGAQKLCVKMRFAGDMGDDHRRPAAVSPHRLRPGENERSMLQVPTLTREMAEANLPPHKRARYDGPSASLHWPYGDSPAVWGGQFLSDAPHMYGMRAQFSGTTYGTDPRMPIRRSSTPESVPPMQHYSPPQVRSGRGAMRIASNRSTASPSTTPVLRQGISVSNRGKGPRKPAACRNNLSTFASAVTSEREGAASPVSPTPKPSSESVTSADLSAEAHRIGSSVQAVAVAISRKTKRKLPLAAKKAEESTVEAETKTDAASAAGETETIGATNVIAGPVAVEAKN